MHFLCWYHQMKLENWVSFQKWAFCMKYESFKLTSTAFLHLPFNSTKLSEFQTKRTFCSIWSIPDFTGCPKKYGLQELVYIFFLASTWAEKQLSAGQQLLGGTFAGKMSSLFNLILWEIIIEISSVVRGSKQIWPPIWIKQICSLVWINFLPKSFASSHNRGNFYNYFHSIELNNDDIFPAKVPPSSCCPVLSCFSAHVACQFLM